MNSYDIPARRDVILERERQVSHEGYTTLMDDRYRSEELVRAAACYVICCFVPMASFIPTTWPWGHDNWKPRDRRRNLVRAAALIIAEIERMDRAERDPKRPAAFPTNPEAM